VARYFLQMPRYKILDAMGKGIKMSGLLVLAERERERELHLGVISLNYINTAPIVVVHLKATNAVENCSA